MTSAIALSGVSDTTLSKAEAKKLVGELTAALKRKKTAIDDLEQVANGITP